MPQQLIDFWSPFDPYGVPPYEHPSDQRALASIRPDRTTSTIDAFIADRKFDGVYFKALRDLARRLAVIQLVPYRSLDYPTGLDGQLMSSIAARDCVKRLEAEGRTIIPVRRARDWGSAASGRPNRKAWMTPKTDAGKAILRGYGIDPT